MLFTASHFIYSDAGLHVCLTKLDYSTYQVLDRVENGRKKEPYDRVPCKSSRDVFLYPIPCDIHHYSATVALTAIVRIEYRGKHLADITFTTPTWRISEDDWDNDNEYYSVQVVRQWPTVEASLEAAFSTGALAPDSAPGIAEAQNDMQGLLASERKKLISTAWLDPITAKGAEKEKIRTAVDGLSDYKTLLWALAQIGLPSAFDQDQEFHALLSDSNIGLLDRLEIIEKLRFLTSPEASADDTQQFDFNNYHSQARQSVLRFRSLLDQKTAAAKQRGGDIPEAIANGLIGLQKIQQAYSSCAIPPHGMLR